MSDTFPKPFDALASDAKTDANPWLVDRILTNQRPLIIAGPLQSLKSSILMDMMISLGSGTPFLGTFPVPGRLEVGHFHGNSEYAFGNKVVSSVIESRGLSCDQISKCKWWSKLPKLCCHRSLSRFSKTIRKRGYQVVAIDPPCECYYGSYVGKHPDIYALSGLFSDTAAAVMDAGAVPIFTCRLGRDREWFYEPPDLKEITYGPIDDFGFQWLLIGRRERYEPNTGIHRLWLTAPGASAGRWAVDVDENFEEDYWNVKVSKAGVTKRLPGFGIN